MKARGLWPYLFEFVFVIFGVTVAFQIQKIDEDRREANAARTLREGLASEMALNRTELVSLARLSPIESTSAVFGLLRAGDRSASDHLASSLGSLYSVYAPDIQTGQLDAYLGSDLSATSTGRPELLDLRNRLDELRAVDQILFDFQLGPVLTALGPHYDAVNATIVDPDFVWGVEFRNTIAVLRALQLNQLDVQTHALCALVAAREALELPPPPAAPDSLAGGDETLEQCADKEESP